MKHKPSKSNKRSVYAPNGKRWAVVLQEAGIVPDATEAEHVISATAHDPAAGRQVEVWLSQYAEVIAGRAA